MFKTSLTSIQNILEFTLNNFSFIIRKVVLIFFHIIIGQEICNTNILLFICIDSLLNRIFFFCTKRFFVATLAVGSRPRQRGCKVAGQEEAGESHHLFPGVLESVKKYEAMNPHTPKATPTLGDGIPVDSWNFRKRLQGSKLNGLGRSLYHWKALGT